MIATGCLQSLSCGWCYNPHNPSVGVCVHGSFTEPDAGMDSCREKLLPIFDRYYNMSVQLRRQASRNNKSTVYLDNYNQIKETENKHSKDFVVRSFSFDEYSTPQNRNEIIHQLSDGSIISLILNEAWRNVAPLYTYTKVT